MHYSPSPRNIFPVQMSLKSKGERDGTKYAYGWRVVPMADMRAVAQSLLTHASGAAVWEGGHRLKETFLYSDVCQMDFETPDFTLADAKKIFCDIYHCVLTTKNHQLVKGGEPPIDRFRVIAPWERRITDLDEYEFNMHRLHEKYGVDPQALDGGRFFWWCEMAVAGNNDAGLCLDVAPISDSWVSNKVKHETDMWNLSLRAESKTLSNTVLAYLDFGTVPGNRNMAIYQTAKEMAATGCTPAEVYGAILASPITKRGEPMAQKEIENTILSAYKYVQKNLTQGSDCGRSEDREEERAGCGGEVSELSMGYER